MVEIFTFDWLPRTITGERDFFARIPDVLRDWVSYAGRRRSVPAGRLREAVAAIEDCRNEMLDAVDDPMSWGPAKSFAAAALEAGVDLTDRADVERFIHRYDGGLAA